MKPFVLVGDSSPLSGTELHFKETVTSRSFTCTSTGWRKTVLDFSPGGMKQQHPTALQTVSNTRSVLQVFLQVTGLVRYKLF